MPTIIPKYRCNYCDQTKCSKDVFERHVIYCKYVHTSQKERDLQEITLPSQQMMYQMLMDLNIKYEQLEKKIERIQNNQCSQSRKSIVQYLKNLSPLKITFSKWIEGIFIDKQHLKLFFDKSFVDAVNKAIVETVSVCKLETIPIRNYTQKPNQLYVYDCVESCSNLFEWRIMTTKDWRYILSIFSKKIVKMYFEWKKENQEYIDANETITELNYEYMKKVNDISQNVDVKIRKIREVIMKQIQTSLTIIE